MSLRRCTKAMNARLASQTSADAPIPAMPMRAPNSQSNAGPPPMIAKAKCSGLRMTITNSAQSHSKPSRNGATAIVRPTVAAVRPPITTAPISQAGTHSKRPTPIAPPLGRLNLSATARPFPLLPTTIA